MNGTQVWDLNPQDDIVWSNIQRTEKNRNTERLESSSRGLNNEEGFIDRLADIFWLNLVSIESSPLKKILDESSVNIEVRICIALILLSGENIGNKLCSLRVELSGNHEAISLIDKLIEHLQS